MGNVVSTFVPKLQVGAHYLDVINKAWDDKQEQDDAHGRAVIDKLPLNPPSRAIARWDLGSRHHPRLLAQALALERNQGGAASLLAPVTRLPGATASALAPAIKLPMPGMSSMASSFSKAIAQGVNPIVHAALEKAREANPAADVRPPSTVSFARSIAMRQRNNLARILRRPLVLGR